MGKTVRLAVLSTAALVAAALGGVVGLRAAQPQQQATLAGQLMADVQGKSSGCVSCHTATDSASMHPTDTVQLACTDCHGGNSAVRITAGQQSGTREYDVVKRKAHVLPRSMDPNSAANPSRVYTGWLQESPEYIQFVNPGDLRVADRTCGTSGCHVAE